MKQEWLCISNSYWTIGTGVFITLFFQYLKIFENLNNNVFIKYNLFPVPDETNDLDKRKIVSFVSKEICFIFWMVVIWSISKQFIKITYP